MKGRELESVRSIPANMTTRYENPLKPGELLPTLEELCASKKRDGIPEEAAWIWGPDDEVSTH